MADDSTKLSFHWLDYVVFSLSLVVGLIIGIVSMVKSKYQKSSDEYLLGGGDMNVLAVGASLLVSGLNAVFLLGGMAEVYYRGAIYSLMVISFVPNLFVTLFIYVPTWKKMKVTSAYEFLEKRFECLPVRLLAAFLFSAKFLLFLSVVLYAPSMALSQVTGLSMHFSIIVCGIVCGIYTSMGGLKAVIYTDAMQALIMLVGLVVVCVIGSSQAGGSSEVFKTAKEIGRFNFDNYSLDPHERHTVFSVTIGLAFTWGMGGLSDQIYVQRYMAVKDVKAAQMSVIVSKILLLATLALVTALGIIASVFYIDCDPLHNGDITKGDQLLPYFFMDVLGEYPGVPGLFIASIFAAALSTVSSTINSLTAVFLEDFIKPFKLRVGTPIPKGQEHIYAKALSVTFGVLSIALSYLAPLMGDVIIQIPPTVHGAIGAPLFSLFFFGFFVSWANKWGALAGSILGLAINLWIGIGSIVVGKSATNDDLPVGQCLGNGTDAITENWHQVSTESVASDMIDSPLRGLYDISYTWYALIGLVTSLVSGIIVSYITNRLGFGKKCGHLEERPDDKAEKKEVISMEAVL